MNKRRGLIVDDDNDLAKFLKIVLGLAGFECETAPSPKAALNYLATNEPDLIFLDLNLGADIQGRDLLYHIRSNPRFDNTRVIIITGYPGLAQQVSSLADLVLLKPVEIDQLSKLASRLLMMEVKPYEFRDPLTGLYNLKFFNTRLELAFDRAKRRPDFIFAVVVIDLAVPDREQALSETEWEQSLRVVAGRWMAKFRPTDLFGRLSRKLIVGLFEDLKHPQDAQVIVGRLMSELSLPVKLEERSVRLSACIGVVVDPGGYSSAQEILDGTLQALERDRLGEGVRYSTHEPEQPQAMDQETY
jgi:PleD family two-component response regulator